MDTRNLKGCSASSIPEGNAAVCAKEKGIWEETSVLSGQTKTVE